MDSKTRKIFDNRKPTCLIILAILVHIIILCAAFDLYFSSPIDNGMTPIKSTKSPPAKRVVFLVADGLRADFIFSDNRTNNAPYLNYVRKTRASWGVSHTRVPTESRPGHVALFAGIYEDPSALLKGWAVNPVDFDSVINQSTNAWCWGGPSVVNLFNRDNLSHIHLFSFDPKMEDYGNNDTIALDKWVFDEVSDYLTNCKNCDTIYQNGNLFFLHLLGTDTAGHAFKPGSEQYDNNVRFVDDNIPKMEDLFYKTFKDNDTAFVFTADHGMTYWGSHGAGSKDETETPLIAWGKGIKIDQKRKDVQQIDIAPLVAALLGINYPINNLGQLPYEYIDETWDVISEMVLSNIYQLLEIFNVKRYRRKNNALRFVPYKGKSTEDINEMLTYIGGLKTFDKMETFFSEAEKFMNFLIDGADYYHNYYQLPILISITVGVVAWILYLASFNTLLTRVNPPKIVYVEGSIFLPWYLTTLYVLKVQSLPFMYYIYFLFPTILCQLVVRRYEYSLHLLRRMRNHGFRKALRSISIYGIGLFLLIKGFQYRQFYSVVVVLLAAFFLFPNFLGLNVTRKLQRKWLLCCLVLMYFPLLPVMKVTFNPYAYTIGFILWWICFQRLMIEENNIEDKVVQIQMLILKLTPIYVFLIEWEFIGFKSPLKYLTWIWAFLPIMLIPFSKTHMMVRTTSIFLGFGTFYLLVTSNYENIFIVTFIYLLKLWLITEGQFFGYVSVNSVQFDKVSIEDNNVNSDDFRRAFIFISLIFIGFFGTGNIASLNSFDPMWVRCFVTVFSPFKMGALLLLRITVPFVYVSCIYRGINLLRRANTTNMFCIVLMYSDTMLLGLLYCITNVGSWLEIGTSLSHFIIMEAFVVILLILYGFAYFITSKGWNNRYLT